MAEAMDLRLSCACLAISKTSDATIRECRQVLPLGGTWWGSSCAFFSFVERFSRSASHEREGFELYLSLQLFCPFQTSCYTATAFTFVW